MTIPRDNPVTEISVLVPSVSDVGQGFVPGRHGMKPVRVVTLAEFKQSAWQGLGPTVRQDLIAWVELRGAIEKRDYLVLSRYKKQLFKWLSKPSTTTDPALLAIQSELVRKMLADRLTEGVSSKTERARFILWWVPKGEFRAALLCPDIKTAFYVLAALRLTGGKSFLVCPRCKRPFIGSRSDQRYCSIRCRDAHRQARHRERHKRKAVRRKKRLARKTHKRR